VKQPACRKVDRTLLVLLARLVRNWKQALFIVQPDTLLRWYRVSGVNHSNQAMRIEITGDRPHPEVYCLNATTVRCSHLRTRYSFHHSNAKEDLLA